MNLAMRAPNPLPLFIAQCDGGPQPWIGWRPRSGREVKWEWDSVPIRWVPVGVNPTFSPLDLNLNINISS
jgi:hypothetical protein